MHCEKLQLRKKIIKYNFFFFFYFDDFRRFIVNSINIRLVSLIDRELRKFGINFLNKVFKFLI